MPTKKYLHNIDLAQNQLQNAVVENRTSAPSGAVDGQLYYNTTDKKLYSFNASGSTWGTIASQYIETDPVFVASAAFNVTTVKISNWDAAFGWGNHSSAGYLTTALAASTYQPLDGDLTAIAALAGTSGFLKKTAANTWTLDTNTYLTSFTETDPIFTASAAFGITSTNISNWNTAYGWGNHAVAGYQLTSQKGVANGYASLDGSGLVPSTQLPSYVDDVLEFANLAAFPATGTTGKIYVALDTNETYRWSGSAYIRIANGAVQSVNGNTGIVTITLASLGGISLTSLSSTATGLTYTNTTGVFSLTSGYAIPTTTSQTNWDAAFTDRLKWDGGSTGLVAATGRTSLGATTVGSNVFTLTNPSAITFIRINADNSVSTLDAATFRTAIGAGTSSTAGTVTSVSVTTANGISGTVATASTTPAITLTLGAITPTSVNSVVISGSSTPTLAVTGTSSISGSNTGDNAVNSLYSSLVSNATHTGDATGATALTVVGLRGVALPTLGASAGFLRYTGTGTNTWVFDTATYLTANQSITLSGDVSGTGSTAITTTIGANRVTNAMLAQIPTATFHGRVTAATGNVENITGTQATTLLDVFTSTLKGLAPASGGGTTNFLRADGTWAAPSGTGGGTVNSVSVVSANGFAGTVATSTTTPAITLTTTITGILKGNGTAISAAVAGTDYQGASTNLTSLAGLTFASTSFVKMTAAGTFALDTNTYYLASNPSGYTTNTGTVTSVSITPANGISGSVATSTTTPAITLTLGAITPTSVNGLTFTAAATGFTIAGGTTSKTLTISNTLTLAGTDSSTLNIGAGGTLGSAAFTASTAYQASSTNLTSLAGLTFASTSFVKMTAAGSFALDTNTYYLASNPSGYTNNTGTVTSITLATGTTGTDVNVSGSPVTTSGTITLNIPDASASARGLVTIGTQTFGGDKTFSNTLAVNGSTNVNGITFGNANANIYGLSTAGFTSSTASNHILPGSATLVLRYALAGTGSTTLATGVNAAGYIIGGGPITTFTSGTHPLLAALGIKPLAITSGGATVTNSATLYIEAAATGATNNYAAWVDAGTVRIDDKLLIGTGVDNGAATLQVTGQMRLNSYLTTTSFTGTAAGYLAFDASGNIITVAAPSGGGITTLNTLTAATQTFATGTTGTDFNISSTGGVHTFNIPDAGISVRGLVTTGAQTFAGNKTFSATPSFNAGIISSNTGANIYIPSGGAEQYSTNSPYLIGGASSTTLRITLAGGTSSSAFGTANASYSGVIIGSNTFNTSSTASAHPIVASFAVKPVIGTVNTGTITNSATVYIEGPSALTATNVYSLWVDAGAVRLDTLGGSGTRMVVADALGVLSTQAIPGGSFTVTNETDNRVITSTGTAAANAEANLTFNGSTLAVNGNVLIGAASSNYSLDIYHPTAAYFGLYTATTTTGSARGFQFGIQDVGAAFVLRENIPMDFYTNNIKRLTINAAGNLVLVTALAQDDALTQVLVRDTGTGQIKYRAASTLLGYSVTSVSTTYSETATSGTKIIKATTAGGTFVITLPTAVGNTATIIIKKIAGTAVLTIDGDGTETIDGGLTASMNKVDESITLVSDNSNWLII